MGLRRRPMPPSIEEYFGFDTLPFHKAIDDDELWLPESKRQIVDAICRVVERRQNLVLTGEPGAGMTCVLRAVRHHQTAVIPCRVSAFLPS